MGSMAATSLKVARSAAGKTGVAFFTESSFRRTGPVKWRPAAGRTPPGPRLGPGSGERAGGGRDR
jgi:hypothetical protein